jgi:hypothetical protein
MNEEGRQGFREGKSGEAVGLSRHSILFSEFQDKPQSCSSWQNSTPAGLWFLRLLFRNWSFQITFRLYMTVWQGG